MQDMIPAIAACLRWAAMELLAAATRGAGLCRGIKISARAIF
jgi:hypothetical protein